LEGSAQKQEQVIQKGPKTSTPASSDLSVPREPTAFGMFKLNYPSYAGKENEFVWALVYIEWLGQNKGEDFLRASLWDDFIRTLSAEFYQYIREATKAQLPREKLKSGFAYFNKLDKAPLFQDRIITPENIKESIHNLPIEAVLKARSKFDQESSSLVEPPQPESSKGTSSVASDSQARQQKRTSFISPLANVSGPSGSNTVQDPKPRDEPQRHAKPRFFETASQLPAAKRQRSSDHFNAQRVEFESPMSSSIKKRRSLPWRSSSPAPSASSRRTEPAPASSSRSTAAASKPLNLRSGEHVSEPRSAKSSITQESDTRSPSISSRNRASTSRSREVQRSKSSNSFTGSPASPILGQVEPVTRSFFAIDYRSRTVSTSRSNMKSSAPRPSSIHRTTSLVEDSDKVHRWLDQRPDPTPQASRTTLLKHERHSDSASVDVPAVSALHPDPKRRKTMPATVTAARANSGEAGQSKEGLTDWQIYLKERKRKRENGELPPLGSAKKARKQKSVLLEPETQAWN
jgi:hypothetical protein